MIGNLLPALLVLHTTILEKVVANLTANLMAKVLMTSAAVRGDNTTDNVSELTNWRVVFGI
jgi:hypothetical protein